MIGGKTYSLLRNLLFPASPKEKDFSALVTELKNHFKPKKVIIVERFNFTGAINKLVKVSPRMLQSCGDWPQTVHLMCTSPRHYTTNSCVGYVAKLLNDAC